MGPKLKILVVSDRMSERDALALTLGDRGFHPRVASTFELAFAAAHEQPDLVVFDAQSLHADETARELREVAVASPVIILADGPSTELDAFAAQCGAGGHIGRTGSPEAIAKGVERFLVQRSEEPREPVRKRVDFVGLARRSTRDEFVASWPCPFLVSMSSLVAQSHKKATADILDSAVLQAIHDAVREKVETRQTGRGYVDTPKKPTAIALPIRGAKGGAEDKISVGRGLDVDVFIDHATISKRHAWFFHAPEGLRVTDAGSRNGTWVGGQLLEPNGPPSPIVQSEDSVRFGELEFTFLSSAEAWDVLRVNAR
jgi:CheY-like chemotaxis protein